MRYYEANQAVIANCGSRKNPSYELGTVIEVIEPASRPYLVRLQKPYDGRTDWYFPASMLKADTRRNRRASGIDIELK